MNYVKKSDHLKCTLILMENGEWRMESRLARQQIRNQKLEISNQKLEIFYKLSPKSFLNCAISFSGQSDTGWRPPMKKRNTGGS